MAQRLRQSTQVVVPVGPFMDSTDAVTPETGITLSGADQAELLKAGGAATVSLASATWAAISGCEGWYNLTLTTAMVDTTGTLVVVVQDTSICLPVFAKFQVVSQNAFDALYGPSANLGTQINKIDAMKTIIDTFTAAHAEPTGLPPANETWMNKSAWVFKTLRERVDVLEDALKYYNSDGTIGWKKPLSYDGTTYTEGQAEAP